MKSIFTKLSLLAVLALTLIVAGCSTDAGTGTGGFTEITGIEAGAGIMTATETAIEEYGLDIELTSSSSAVMAASLAEAIENEEWIVVTGWTPHWKFAAHDLKYLDDPLNIYGGDEDIHTLVRKGLEQDHPEAYQVLDNFYWTPDDMNQVMVDFSQNGMTEEEAAQAWIDNNRDTVDSWIDGVGTVNGETIELALVLWDSEIASTNVVALVLEEIGYNVEITSFEPGVMYASIADGSSDAMVAAWLPGTHGHFVEQFEADLVDLGPNLNGTRIGLVVPAYVTIDSIEEITKR